MFIPWFQGWTFGHLTRKSFHAIWKVPSCARCWSSTYNTGLLSFQCLQLMPCAFKTAIHYILKCEQGPFTLSRTYFCANVTGMHTMTFLKAHNTIIIASKCLSPCPFIYYYFYMSDLFRQSFDLLLSSASPPPTVQYNSESFWKYLFFTLSACFGELMKLWLSC